MTDKWFNKTSVQPRKDGKTSRGSYSKITYRRMIRKMCLHCCGNQVVEVTECPATDCPLWTARSGKTMPDAQEPSPFPKLDCI